MLLSGTVRAVILPATPLLVPGLVPGLSADPLAEVREAVGSALTELTAGGRVPLVLAHGRVLRHGRLRPSLEASGIADRWLPGAVPTGPSTGLPAAGTGASVALLSLGAVLGPRAADIETLEVPPTETGHDQAVVDLVRAADGLVVAGGGVPGATFSGSPDGSGASGVSGDGPTTLTPGLRSLLRAAGAATWRAADEVFRQEHEQLPAEYHVTTLT